MAAVSDTLFNVGGLTAYNELAASCTVMLTVFELISATVEGVVILTFPPDDNMLRDIIIIIIINCGWVVTRWQWLFYMYTKYEIGYY